MVKRCLYFLLGCFVFPLYAQVLDNNHFTFQLIRKNSKFYGYYLPLDFVEAFENSRDWFSSRKYIDDRQDIEGSKCIKEMDYIYIRIDQEGIWVQEPIRGDGFSEELIDYKNGIENYKYEIGNNNEIIIFKKNGKKYKKVSNNFEYDYSTIDNYIGKIVLSDFILSGEIIFDNNIITIPALNFGKFRIDTWGNYSECYATLYVYCFDRGWWLDMNVEGDLITIYTYETWIFESRTGKKIYWTNKM